MNKKLKVSLLIILIVIMNVILLNSHCVMANSNVEGYIANEEEKDEKTVSSVDHATGVTTEMCNPTYWENLLTDGDDVILTTEKIIELNNKILTEAATNMYDLENMKEEYNADSYTKLLANRTIPTRKLYINGQLINNTEYFSELIEAIKTTGYTGIQNIRYGIVTNRADLKSWPIDDVIGYSADDTDDEMESSAANVNEPFIIKGKCENNGETYYYGFTSNCSGWTNAKNIAICSNKEEWLGAWKVQVGNNDFVVVTQDKITLESFLTSPETSDVKLMLGTVLKLVPDSEKPENISGRGTWNNYVVYLPTRDEEGNYVKKYALIPEHYAVNKGLNVGYLPLTENNILDVAFTCLGNAYGWGGMLGNMDCSMYTRYVYRCFGLEMPRNTTWQQKTPGKLVNLSGLNAEEKEKLLETMPAGTLLYFPGHTMIYTGSINSTSYVISDTGSLADSPEGTSVIPQYSVILNPLTCKRKNGQTWLENLTSAICFSKDIDINDCDINLEYIDSKYNGMEIKPKVEIKYKGRTLYEGINYEVEYENNVGVGTAKVKITGERNFSGEVSKEFYIKLSPETYNFLDLTDNQSYIINKDSILSVRIDAEFAKFQNVYIDGKLLNKDNYTVYSGSTIISFNKNYLDSLSVGTHSIKVEFIDGVATTDFTISKADIIEETDEVNNEKNSNSISKIVSLNPATGDDIYIVFVLFVETISFIGYIIYNKKSKK